MKKINLLILVSITAFVSLCLIFLSFGIIEGILSSRSDFIFGYLLWAGIFMIIIFALFFLSLIKDSQILTIRFGTRKVSYIILPLFFIILSLPFWFLSIFSTFGVLFKVAFTQSGIMALMTGIVYRYFESESVKKLYILFSILALLSLSTLLLGFFPF